MEISEHPTSGGIVVGVDIGGTFTDAVALDTATGEVSVAKALTTPAAPAEGLLNALAGTGVDLSQIGRLFHGTTLGLNTALERSGATVGLIMSEGCRDVVEIGRMNWPMHRLYFDQQAPLVPRYLRRAIAERITAGGDEVVAVDDANVADAVRELVAEGAEYIAVVLMHAYAFPANERRVGEIIEREFPDVGVVLSHEVAAEYREYERTVTSVVEATTKPRLGAYLDELRRDLAERGFAGELFITRSDGGVMSVSEAKHSCVQTLVSGPASGIAGAADLGRRMGISNLLTIDVGGTSFDASLIRDGQPLLQPMTEIEGLPRLLMPSIEVAAIGAGGGSIAWLDRAGTLHVGPHSAGSVPGPICYGRGGTEPTFTDAALVSGILESSSFLGGRMTLDLDAARAGIERQIARPLGLDVEEAAAGIVTLVEAKMSHKLEEITIGRGADPREFVMVAYGGGGALVADALAERIGVERVLIPPAPGMFSARGMLTLDVVYTLSQTKVRALDQAGLDALGAELRRLAAEGARKLTTEGIAGDRQRLTGGVDLRYDLQEHALTVALEDLTELPDVAALAEAFHATHESAYGYRLAEPVQLVACRVRAVGLIDKPPARDAHSPVVQEDALLGHRVATHRESGGTFEWAVYDRARLAVGEVVDGPALVQELSTTTLVRPGRQAAPDEYGNLLITTALVRGAEADVARRQAVLR